MEVEPHDELIVMIGKSDINDAIVAAAPWTPGVMTRSRYPVDVSRMTGVEMIDAIGWILHRARCGQVALVEALKTALGADGDEIVVNGRAVSLPVAAIALAGALDGFAGIGGEG